MKICRVTNRRCVTGSVPGSAHAKCFTQGCNFSCWGDSTKLGDMRADKINQLFSDQRTPFQRIVMQFAHRDRYGRLTTQTAEPLGLVWCERVLEEEQAIRLQGFRQ